ncbi:unnamed protein product, partial [Tetraodon nigroviridis]
NAFGWKSVGQELRPNDLTTELPRFQHGNRALASKVMKKTQDRGMGHSEESRLANLLRRVSREDDRDRRLSTLRQLREFISHSESKVVSFITLLFLSHNIYNFIKISFISCHKLVVGHSLGRCLIFFFGQCLQPILFFYMTRKYVRGSKYSL